MWQLFKQKNTASEPPGPNAASAEVPDAKQVLDKIEAAVYAHLKPLGFHKHGRTLHRFVSGDLSQVVSFQVWREMLEPSDKFCVNLGIRVPECAECSFHPINDKKYYSEAFCTLRSRLGKVSGGKETWFSLADNTEALCKRIIEELDQFVLPVFEVLCSREAILVNCSPSCEKDGGLRRLDALDACFLYGHLGNMKKAKERFDANYQEAVARYEKICREGEQLYLAEGTHCLAGGKEIYADHSGYYTICNPIPLRKHIAYLDQLAVELGFRETATPE